MYRLNTELHIYIHFYILISTVVFSLDKLLTYKPLECNKMYKSVTWPACFSLSDYQWLCCSWIYSVPSQKICYTKVGSVFFWEHQAHHNIIHCTLNNPPPPQPKISIPTLEPPQEDPPTFYSDSLLTLLYF